MENHFGATMSLSLYLLTFLADMQACGSNPPDQTTREPVLSMKLGGLRITNKSLDLRYRITNNSAQDIWLYGNPSEYFGVQTPGETYARVLFDEGSRTLLIVARSNRLSIGSSSKVYATVYAPYVRLAAGQSQPQGVSIHFPLPREFCWDPAVGFAQAKDHGVENIARLTLEVGYYTTEYLESRKSNLLGYQAIRFDEPGDRVFIGDATPGDLVDAEHTISLTVDGLCIPYKQWLYCEREPEYYAGPSATFTRSLTRVFHDNMKRLRPADYWYAHELFQFDPNLFNESARRIADLYVQLTEGKLDPAKFSQELDSAMSKSERDKLLQELRRKRAAAMAPKPAPMKPIQLLENMFYSFLLDVEQYRYAEQLLSLDEGLLTGPARQIADVYVQVAQGKLSPSELTTRLDAILPKNARDDLLRELQKKQGEADQKR